MIVFIRDYKIKTKFYISQFSQMPPPEKETNIKKSEEIRFAHCEFC